VRHRVRGRQLNRDIKHRKALFKNLISSLFLFGEIKTTLAKAKSIRGLVDKLITKAKKGTLHHRRLVAAFLQNKQAVNKLVNDLTPKLKQRTSGFTRIIRLGQRRGDATEMVKMELITDKAETKVKAKTKTTSQKLTKKESAKKS
jgi:large subunit ribosomal protein L17